MILLKILGTSGSRILGAISNLVLLWLATNKLGSEAWGLSGLILLDVSLILLVADMAGNALVFYIPRRKLGSLVRLAVIWSVLTVLFFGLLFLGLSFAPAVYHLLIPQGYGVHILLLVLTISLHGFNLNVLLGKGKMKAFNFLFTFQFSLMLLAMTVMIFLFEITDERAFVAALYVSYIVPFAVGCVLIYRLSNNNSSSYPKATMRELLQYGSMTQLSSIAHMLNKRLSFYVIRHFTGLSALGIYNSGTQLTEGLRLIGQSIALVQFSSISNSEDKDFAKNLSIQLLKISVIVTALATTFLAVIPTSFFKIIFGSEFGSIKIVIISLSPGVVALAANAIFSHYFSGTGTPKYNLWASLIGLCIAIPTVFILIPAYGMVGAGVSASLAYSGAVVYQWIVFKKMTQSKINDLLINKTDFKVAITSIKKLL